jgi:hypothetical protein
MRRNFGPKREEVAGGWRKVHNEEHHNLYTSPNINRVIKSRRTRMDLSEIVWEGVEWIYLAHDRDKWRALVNPLMNIRVP